MFDSLSDIPEAMWFIAICTATFVAVFLGVRYGWPRSIVMLRRQEAWFDRVLNQQLLLDTDPKLAIGMAGLGSLIAGMLGAMILKGVIGFLLFAGIAQLIPLLVVNHLESKRKHKLEEQLVDGITALASGVRAGLNLVQAMELLVSNSTGPIKQEFSQLLREYAMGLDLNAAMRNAANRMNLGSYRLLFTALEMHRKRGGDAGQTLDRIAESIREIQRLEGKLDALTAQGRYQAWGMAAMPVLFVGIYYLIDSEAVEILFTETSGRIILLCAIGLICLGHTWIRRILAVDI